MELRTTEVCVESTEVEDGAEPISALGTQEVRGNKSLWSCESWTVSPPPLVRREVTFPTAPLSSSAAIVSTGILDK